MKHGGYAIRERKKTQLRQAYSVKAGYKQGVSDKLFPYQVFCKTHSGISVKVPASVNSLGRGFSKDLVFPVFKTV